MNKQNRLFRAMTLVELMIGLSLGTVLMTAVSSALITQTNGVRINDGQIRSRHGANAAMNFMLSKIRRAKELTLLPAGAADGAYTDLITLDEATWVLTDGVGDWADATCTHFSIQKGELLMQKYPLGAKPKAKDWTRVLKGAKDIRFRSADSGEGHQSVTVEMNVDYADDAFHGASIGSYAIAGTAVARCTQE